MYVVCKEHLEIAIDRFIDEYEEAPDLYALSEVSFKEWAPPHLCEEKGCKHEALFLVI
ncbi:CxxH/CxxC protein, BA_5709 family [Chlamydia abortus]|nr:CxxH/CxxC protein, BA_5709 family [Chlamydia abortus]